MSITKEKIGVVNNENVYEYTLDNEKGLTVKILNLGGIIKSIIFDGTDVVLGRDTLEEYLKNDGYFGALVGRNANRIANAEFELNGKTYKLFVNNGKNNLHGGKVGFDKKVWKGKMKDGDEPALELTLVSPDGDEGFPGKVKVKVTYTLTKDNGLKIHYFGKSDKDTVLNMTNHSYFNLNGHNSGDVFGHTLSLNSEFYTPNTAECMPTGEVASVKGTPFDFTQEAKLEERIKSDYEQIKMFKGFDHNFFLNGFGFKKAGKLTGDKTGISMEVYTDQSGMQIYTANGAGSDRVCKGGAVYGDYQGICFETQYPAKNLNFSHFPSAILKKNETYETTTEFRFFKK